MAKKQTPAALREKARLYALKAKEEENKRYMQVGRLVENELIKKDGKVADLPALKHKIAEILEN